MNLTSPKNGAGGLTAHLGRIFQDRSQNLTVLKTSRDLRVYTAGERDDNIYLIESGFVKLLLPGLGGSNTLIAIYRAGDLFGESCLAGPAIRTETAVAMQNSSILKIPRDVFMAVLGRDRLLMSMAQCLATRIADRQQTIASLLAENREG